MKKLNAMNLKQALWETLNAIKTGKLNPQKGGAIASQAREILRTVKVQSQILDKAKKEMTPELTGFADNG